MTTPQNTISPRLAPLSSWLTYLSPWLTYLSPWLAYLSPWLTYLSPWLAYLSPWLAYLSPWLTYLSPWLARSGARHGIAPHTPRAFFCALFACALFPAFTAAQDEPAPTPAPNAAEEAQVQPAPATLTVRDMVVLRVDKFSQTANDPADYPSTLFNGAQRTRHTPPNANPAGPAMPLGLITFEGRIESPLRLDLALPDNSQSDFLGHWPGYAGESEATLAWRGIQHVGENPRRPGIKPDNHWLIPMSQAKDRIHFDARGHTSRFIAYDPSFAYTPSLEVKLEDEAYLVTGQSLPTAPLVMLVKRDGDQFFAARADSAGVFDMQAPLHANAHSALAPLAEAFLSQGFSQTETQTVLAMVTQAGLATDNLALVYLINQPTLDTLIPLTLRPALGADDQLIRQGVVIVTNIDPKIGSIVETLIEKLGDPSWAIREQAHQQLLAMDRAALEQIRQHTDHPDPEVTYRIEQILNAQPADR